MGLRTVLSEAPEIIAKVHAFLNLRDNVRLSIYLRQEGLVEAFQAQYPLNAELIDRTFGNRENALEHGPR